MSLTRSQRVRLGVFMVTGISLLLIFVSIPVGAKLMDRQKEYFAYFEGESLSGLENGAVVKYHGVPIGKVSRIMYDPQNIVRVKVVLRMQADFPLKEDMYIQTGMMGITGLKYVEIMGGSNQAPLLKPGSIITVKPSLMASITGKADVIVAKIELLLNHITTLTDPDSLTAIRQILGNVEGITGDVRAFVADVKPSVTSVSHALATTASRLDTIVTDVRGVTANLNRTIDAEQLGAILQSVDETAKSMKNLSENLDLTIRQTREDFTISMENLKETMENANELMKVLAENPSLLLKGEPQRVRGLK